MTQPDPDLAGAGLSATGKTADQFEPGDAGPGSTYGAPGGTGTEDLEAPHGEVPAAGEAGPDSAAGTASDEDPGSDGDGPPGTAG